MIFYIVECNLCGDSLDAIFPDKLEEALEQAGWKTIGEDEHICPECKPDSVLGDLLL